ncbi:MAG: dihydroorotate dehydrogenase [Ignavibacteriae bacterium]|nr:dihydroorotate dehydrogenase [Ignavibacteriota bacterium]
MVNTQTSIGGLTLKNPVLVASGTFGYGDDCNDLVDVNKLGGIVTKSLSSKPRDGNPPTRIVETPSGMLNSIGLANIGVEKFIKEKLPILQALETAIIVNIAASTIDEYCTVLSRLDEHEGIDAYEINVSCPNVKEGGLSFGTSCEMTAEITRRLRAITTKTLIIKLTPNVAHISEFAHAVADAGADAISVINTIVGMAVDVKTFKPKLSTVTGGLSGPAIKPIALAKVYEVAQAVSIPIIGIGGIMTTEDAIEFLLVGASAIQVGTANFIDPAAGVKIADGLRSFCERMNIDSVTKLIGALQSKKELSIVHSWL